MPASFLKNSIARGLVMLESSLKMWPPLLVVFCYHSISSGSASVQVPQRNFLSQLAFLRKYFAFVSLDQVVGHLNDTLPLAQPSITLTFDDGYEDALTTVAPVLKKNNIPATFFVLARPSLAERSITKHGIPLMTMAQIKKLHHLGFTIGCHTNSHVNLAQANPSVYQAEIVESKKVLEEALGESVRYFAYPQGGYNKEVLAVCKRAGYTAAFSVHAGTVTPHADRLLIPRICISKFHTNIQVAALISKLGITYLNVFKKQEVLLFHKHYGQST